MSASLKQTLAGSFSRKRTEAVHARGSADRILLVSHAAELGGAEQGLLDLARHLGAARCDVLLFHDGPLREALERRGLNVLVLAASPNVLRVKRQAGVIRILRSVPSTLALGWRLGVIAQAYGLIYANSQKAALTAMLAGAFTRHPVIWHLHDILSADHFGWLQRHAIAWLSNYLTHAVIVVSAAGRDALIASGGDPSRISIVHNGIDPAPYAGFSSLMAATIRSELGLPDGRLVGLFGRITQWKGQRVLIRALALLPDTQALIVGSPMFGEDAELAFLKDLAARLGVAQRVHFLGYRADTPKLMRAVDLVVHCSTAPEPFGRVIVEALFAGTPILAASGGASTEILGDDPTWLVQPGRPDALAEAIDRVLNIEAALLAQRLAELRLRVEREFTLARMMQEIEDLVTQVLPGPIEAMKRP